jgi:hypothetical protein
MKASPGPVAVLPSEFKLQQGADAPAMNGLLTRTNAKSAVFTVNGVLCPASSKLPNGLYVFPVPGKNSAKVVNVMR